MKQMIRLIGVTFLWLVSFGAAAAPLVDAGWLLTNMNRPDLVMVDLQSPQGFQRAHIPGAVNSSYDQWRSSPKSPVPKVLPPVKTLEKMIGRLGIDNQTRVVLIPFGQSAGDMASATRVYWTFKALGHESVSILDGGLVGYARGGKNRPLAAGPASPESKVFKAKLNTDFVPTKNTVKAALAAGVAMVDNRSRAEYLGIYGGGGKERAGTIPGAVNMPYDWLTVNGGASFHSLDDLKAIYQASGVPLDGEQISFCHTGHRTSLAWFVSHELLGNKKAKMYDGSMAEWARDRSTPMEKKVELQCKAC